jgi:hypothetical protein
MQLAWAIWRQPQLSFRAKTLFLVLLLGHHNNKTGRCNPTRALLKTELATSENTIKRALAELVKAGWLKQKLTRGAPYYSFPHLVLGGPDVAPHTDGRGASSDRMGGHFCTDGGPDVAHGTTKNHELTYSAASPSPRKGEASAAPNGKSQPPPYPADRPKPSGKSNGTCQDDKARALDDEQWWEKRERQYLAEYERTKDPDLLRRIGHADTKRLQAKRRARGLAWTKKPWTKPTILADEPRDLNEFQLCEGGRHDDEVEANLDTR